MQADTVQPQNLFLKNDYALVLLNQEILMKDEFFVKIWNNAIIRHVVDGGANRFFSFLEKLPENLRKSCKFPDIVSGDFDSISEESMKLLKESCDCKIALTENQDETDFTKALKILHEHFSSENPLQKLAKVVVVCESAGRLDQTLSNLNTLHNNAFLKNCSPSSSSEETIGVFLMGSDSLCWLLPANIQVTIKFQEDVPKLICGVIPLMGSTKYQSKGLQWDLTPDMVCSFGGLISACNIVVSKNVEVISHDNHSIFTLEISQNKYSLPSDKV